MFQSHLATVQNGHIQLSEDICLPEGAKLIVTVLPDNDGDFWRDASEVSLVSVWDNPEDDAYADLLKG